MSEPLILLVDDDPKILRFISANLRLQGFRVNLAHDGAEALEQAAVEPPDLGSLRRIAETGWRQMAIRQRSPAWRGFDANRPMRP